MDLPKLRKKIYNFFSVVSKKEAKYLLKRGDWFRKVVERVKKESCVCYSDDKCEYCIEYEEILEEE